MKERPSDNLDAMVDLERDLLASDDEAVEYLLAGVFFRAMDALRAARMESGLTQKDVAESSTRLSRPSHAWRMPTRVTFPSIGS